MNLLRLIVGSVAALVLVGCAHPIDITPDPRKLTQTPTSRISAKVGYHVPPEVSNIEITTPGGGGDNVRYFPYRAMSSGYQRMLSNVFESVVPVSSLSELQGKSGPPVDYVVIPVVVTNSGGSNFFTWPPENFTVDLTSSIRDKDGKAIASPRVVGVGSATTGERLTDHGFSGRRAFEDALQKMELALREWGSNARSAGPDKPASSSQAYERLRQLKELLDRKMINDQEYETKRKAILADL